MSSFSDVFALVGKTERQRFSKRKRCVRKGKKEAVSVENREEGIRDRTQVIPESNTVQIKCFKLKRLVFYCLTTGKTGSTFT